MTELHKIYRDTRDARERARRERDESDRRELRSRTLQLGSGLTEREALRVLRESD